MRRIQLIIFLLLSIGYTYGQNYLCLARKAGTKEWGYINEKGEFAIQPKYQKSFAFSPGGLAVVLNGKSKQFTFINTKGEQLNTEVTTFRLLELLGFGVKGYNDGMVAIRVDDKWGFLNAEGELAVPAKYEKITEFNGSYASGKIGNKSFIIGSDGSENALDDSNVIDVKHFSDGLAPFTTVEKKSGFVNSSGEIEIPATFQSVGYFINGLAWAKLPEGKVGYINKKGEWVIQPQFDAAKDFDPTSKRARVKSAGQWAYVGDSGEILNMTLDSYGDFAEGLCYGKKAAQVGFFDNKGNWVIEPQFLAVRDFKNGFAAAKQGELWGFIDKKGQWVVKPSFEAVRDMELVR